MELIKSNIPHLPHARVVVPLSLDAPQYLEEMEWSPMFSIQSQNLENAVVSPVEEKVSALLALEALHPDSKKAVTRVLDKFRSLDSFLKGLESVEIDDKRNGLDGEAVPCFPFGRGCNSGLHQQ